MVANVEVVSEEMIKPSSPTPLHLRTHKLSFLDQIAPPVYVPIILFFQPQLGCDNDHRLQISQSLKQSLSYTLTRFYPLAGRIENNISIDCNDAGVEFFEAQVRTHLSQVIEKPNMEELKRFLPIEPYGSKLQILLAIQINFFDSGGIAIGVCMSHKIADGLSLITFINAWAETSREDSKMVNPIFDLACHFPPRDLSGFFTPTAGITKEKIVTRRFVFDEKKLAILKQAVSSAIGSQVKDPTRVEAVSAFIWRHFMEVANTKKKFAAVHAVNLRPRMSSPLPDQAFGNLWRHAVTSTTSEAGDNGYHDLASQLRNAIRKIDDDYVKQLKSGDGYLDYLKRTKELFSKGEIELCNFSSWCRFPVYEVEFGWGGKPVWVCTTTMPFKNVVILMSTRGGEGIEAWLSMLENDMAMLEKDHNLLSLVATDHISA